ncbi:hypothetical protein EYC84_006372 [Monilinia fructicola]|uniref:Methyltransferase domain-containing protein n=1 Tax=Monilinia fructicola TaxID=38448 RepID=A0A5M9K3R0_MONFR|nr:hypothetical protein EYC84_006372 [Monilinia fructicola]
MRQPLPPNTKDQPPDLHYNDTEARKYTTSSRIQNIQASMTNRALELLDLKTPSLLLDIGCGSGLSGEILSAVPEDEGGPHVWVGMDISASMLDIALQRDVEGDLMLSDIGQGVPFRAGKFRRRHQHQCDPMAVQMQRACEVEVVFGVDGWRRDIETANGDITGVVKGMDGVDVLDARRKHIGRRAGRTLRRVARPGFWERKSRWREKERWLRIPVNILAEREILLFRRFGLGKVPNNLKYIKMLSEVDTIPVSSISLKRELETQVEKT